MIWQCTTRASHCLPTCGAGLCADALNPTAHDHRCSLSPWLAALQQGMERCWLCQGNVLHCCFLMCSALPQNVCSSTGSPPHTALRLVVVTIHL